MSVLRACMAAAWAHVGASRLGSCNHGERTRAHPILLQRAEIADYRPARTRPPEQLRIGAEHLARLLDVFANQLDAEAAHPEVEQRREAARRALRARVEHGVPAADIHDH